MINESSKSFVKQNILNIDCFHLSNVRIESVSLFHIIVSN